VKIAIIELISSNDLPYDRHVNSFELASLLKAEGHAVSLSPWTADRPLDELFAGLHEADRILLWDESVYVDIAATKFALAGKKLSDALDEADVMTAACFSGPDTLAVFSGGETFASPRDDLGSALLPTLAERRGPVACGAFGTFFVWIHTGALSRLLPAGGTVTIGGIDCSLSRRMIEGGASVQVDPRIAVVSRLTQTVAWSLPPPT
jgi:hypothetical protein